MSQATRGALCSVTLRCEPVFGRASKGDGPDVARDAQAASGVSTVSGYRTDGRKSSSTCDGPRRRGRLRMTVKEMCSGQIEAGADIDAARRHLAREFLSHGLDTPELDARVLVGHALGLDHAALAAQSRRVLTAAEAHAVSALAARRLAREPVARIIGHKEFWGLRFKLNAETLLPRPETETVVEAALAAVENRRSRALRIADLGTGSGALLLALLSELPTASGVGTDISLAALDCARGNAVALGLHARSAFAACDYGAALAGAFDLVVSNPPYVAGGDIATLQPEVRDLRSPPCARRRARRPGWLPGYCGRCAAASFPHGYPRAGVGAGPARCRRRALCRSGAGAGPRAARPRRHCASPGFAPAAERAVMSPPHSRCPKKHLDCRPRPTRFRPRNRPETVESTDSEPRSRTAESRRCGRNEPRAPDDPAGGSPNRDEMLHRFGADPRVSWMCARGRGGQHCGTPRSRLPEAGGCWFATRNLTSRRTAPYFLPPA